MCAACASDGNTTIAGGPDDAVTSAPPQRVGCRRAGFVDATAVERAVRELEHARRRRQVREHVADDGDDATAVRQVAGGAGSSWSSLSPPLSNQRDTAVNATWCADVTQW